MEDTKLKVGVMSKTRGNFALQSKYLGKPVHDSTPREVEHHVRSLERAGYDVSVIPWGGSIMDNIKGVDLLFNLSSIVETAIAEEMGVPYVGSDTRADSVATDKSLAKIVCLHNGIQTSPFHIAYGVDDCKAFSKSPPFGYPLFVKPLTGRGSAGIGEDSVIDDYAQLERKVESITQTLGPALIERYLQGREITLGVIGNGKERRVLPPLEIRYGDGRRTLTFDSKELDNDKFICPAELSADEKEMMAKIALGAFGAIGLMDYARIDTILTSEGPYVLEANSFAGLSTWPEDNPVSYIGRMALAEGMDGADLLGEIVEAARKRLGI